MVNAEAPPPDRYDEPEFSYDTGLLFYNTGYEGYIAVSADRGSTWVREWTRVDEPYTVTNVWGSASSPDSFFTIVTITGYDLQWRALLVRSGAPGVGSYRFSYLGYNPASFYRVEECAFRDDDHGLATGPSASMYYDGENWVREELGADEYYRNLVADPRGGFWATAENDTALYWHP